MVSNFHRETLGPIKRDFVVCHHVIFFSRFISKSLLKCLHLETSSDILFRRFISWCVAISNFSFKQKLSFIIVRFTHAHLRMVFHAISAPLSVDLRSHTSFESSVSSLYWSLLNDFPFGILGLMGMCFY